MKRCKTCGIIGGWHLNFLHKPYKSNTSNNGKFSQETLNKAQDILGVRCKKCNKRHEKRIEKELNGICPTCTNKVEKGDKIEIDGKEYDIDLLKGEITTVSHGIYWGEYEITGIKAIKAGKEYNIKILKKGV